MRVLFVSGWFPYPVDNGSKIRIMSLVRHLQAEHEVMLLSLTPDTISQEQVRMMEKECAEVKALAIPSYRSSDWRSLSGLFSALPRNLQATFSPQAAELVSAYAGRAEVVVCSELSTLPYVFHTRGRPAILDDPELGVLRGRMTGTGYPLRRLRHRLTWQKLTTWLRRALPRAAACTVVSAHERANLLLAVPGYRHIEIIPNCVDLKGYAGDYQVPAPNSLVFTGSFAYDANIEAIRWFLAEIYPRILAQVPGVRFTITGRATREQLDSLPRRPGLDLAGFVDDVRPFIASSWISVAPLRTGGGTRFKILEAMALNTPVVATRKGAEGLDARDGEHLLIADDPADFAACVIRLLRDAELRAQLVANARQLVREKYDWANTGPRFSQLVTQVGRSL